MRLTKDSRPHRIAWNSLFFLHCEPDRNTVRRRCTLALSLFVFRIRANNHDTSFTTDHFTFFAHDLDRWSNFHNAYLLLFSSCFMQKYLHPKSACYNIIPKTDFKSRVFLHLYRIVCIYLFCAPGYASSGQVIW